MTTNFQEYGILHHPNDYPTCLLGHADINSKDNRGQTVLMIAARRGHMVVAKCLLSHGADPIACDYEALEPLEYCKRGDYRMKKLINRFASMY